MMTIFSFLIHFKHGNNDFVPLRSLQGQVLYTRRYKLTHLADFIQRLYCLIETYCLPWKSNTWF